jgi:hypothetical protein
MRPFCLAVAIAAGIATLASIGLAQAPTSGPYEIIKTVRVGGEGGFDYIFADVKGRRLYTPRGGAKGHLAVFNLDTLEPAGEIENVSAVRFHRRDAGLEMEDRALTLNISDCGSYLRLC